jgi:RNA polymerase sigma factor (sigma-70 family)
MGDSSKFNQLYLQNRTPFLRWANTWANLGEADTLDVYQDACVIFWQKSQAGLELTVQPRTFIFAIGRNLLMSAMRKKGKIIHPPKDEFQLDAADELMDSEEEIMIRTEDLSCLQSILSKLGEACAGIIRMTYFEEMNSDEIATAMGYSTGDVVRTTRKRCMKTLRELWSKHCQPK